MALRMTNAWLWIGCIVAICGCGAEGQPLPPVQPAASPTDSAPPSPQLNGRIVTFLRTQDPAWAALEGDQLDRVDAVSLRKDYTPDDLALLAHLPGLTTLRIVRSGETFAKPAPRRAPTDADLAVIGRLRGLHTLQIGGWSAPYSGAALASLRNLANLRDLSVFSTPSVNDEALEHLLHITSLERLDVTYTKVTDRGLTRLLELPHLKTVRFGWAADSRRALARFRAAHPDAPFTIEP